MKPIMVRRCFSIRESLLLNCGQAVRWNPGLQTKSMNGCRKQKDRGRKIKNETQTKEYRPDRLYGIGEDNTGTETVLSATDAGRRHGQADRETGGQEHHTDFADDGESYFRELETELLRKCGEQKYERILSVEEALRSIR